MIFWHWLAHRSRSLPFSAMRAVLSQTVRGPTDDKDARGLCGNIQERHFVDVGLLLVSPPFASCSSPSRHSFPEPIERLTPFFFL